MWKHVIQVWLQRCDVQASSPAVGLLWFGQWVVEEWISVIGVVLQVQTLLLQSGGGGGGGGPAVRCLTVSGDLLLEVSFTQRRHPVWVLTDDKQTTDRLNQALGPERGEQITQGLKWWSMEATINHVHTQVNLQLLKQLYVVAFDLEISDDSNVYLLFISCSHDMRVYLQI